MHATVPSDAAPCYLVVLPSVGRPVGGVNVLLWLIETLKGAGYSTAALYGQKDYAYDFRSFSGESYYSQQIRDVFRKPFFAQAPGAQVRQAMAGLRGLLRPRRAPGSHPPRRIWEPAPQDVLIVPEFIYPEVMAAFGDRRCILAVQDVFGLMRASLRSRRWRQRGPEAFSAILSTSEACARAVGAVFGAPGDVFRLPVCQAGLRYNPDKTVQIALMPRKRREEARILEALIRAHPDLAGIPVVQIDRVPADEAHRRIRESLFFLSLSDQEGFGLPPAEAMATGSIVIGYDGVGGAEYFTSETGFPIPDGDLVAFVACLAEVVSMWRATPDALERKRRLASDFIWSRYDETTARQSLLARWSDIDAGLRGQAGVGGSSPAPAPA